VQTNEGHNLVGSWELGVGVVMTIIVFLNLFYFRIPQGFISLPESIEVGTLMLLQLVLNLELRLASNLDIPQTNDRVFGSRNGEGATQTENALFVAGVAEGGATGDNHCELGASHFLFSDRELIR
jgi:hypothetical protein